MAEIPLVRYTDKLAGVIKNVEHYHHVTDLTVQDVQQQRRTTTDVENVEYEEEEEETYYPYNVYVKYTTNEDGSTKSTIICNTHYALPVTVLDRSGYAVASKAPNSYSFDWDGASSASENTRCALYLVYRNGSGIQSPGFYWRLVTYESSQENETTISFKQSLYDVYVNVVAFLCIGTLKTVKYSYTDTSGNEHEGYKLQRIGTAVSFTAFTGNELVMRSLLARYGVSAFSMEAMYSNGAVSIKISDGSVRTSGVLTIADTEIQVSASTKLYLDVTYSNEAYQGTYSTTLVSHGSYDPAICYEIGGVTLNDWSNTTPIIISQTYSTIIWVEDRWM